MLTIEHFTKKTKHKTSLNDVSFTWDSKGLYGIYGTEGSGRSELMQCLAGLLPYQEGTIKYQGNKVVDCKTFAVYIGEKLQVLPGYTIPSYGQLLKGLIPSFDEVMYTSLLKEWDLPLNINIAKLPETQQKLCEVAVALSRKLEILLLDEAFKVFQKHEKELLFTKLEEFDKTTLVLFASASKKDMVFTKEVVALQDGGIIAFDQILEEKEEMTDLKKENKQVFYSTVQTSSFFAESGDDDEME